MEFVCANWRLIEAILAVMVLEAKVVMALYIEVLVLAKVENYCGVCGEVMVGL